MSGFAAPLVLARAGVDFHHLPLVQEQGHFHDRTGAEGGGLAAAGGGVALESRVGIDYFQLDKIGRGDRQRRTVVEGHLADILLLQPLGGIPHGVGVRLVLLVGARLHEVPELAVAVQVFHVPVHDIRAFQRLAGLEGALPDPAGFQVAQLDPVERLPLARLDEFVFDDAARLPLQHHLESPPEFIGRIYCHLCCTQRLNLRYDSALGEALTKRETSDLDQSLPVTTEQGGFKMSNHNAATPDIPRQDLPEFPHFGLTGKRARRWAEDLPMTNTGQVARQLRSALGDLNRTDMDPDARFEILQALRPTLHTALSTLSRLYLNQPTVLADAPREAAQLAQDILGLTATAYTIVGIQAHQHRQSLFRANPAKLVCPSLHRAITAASMKMLVSFQLYRPVEQGAWAELHRLFLLAERQDLAHQVVADDIAGDGSVTDTYLRVLMMGCCKPNQLCQQDLAGLFRGLREWVEHIALLPAGDGEGLFWVEPTGDDAPRYAALCGNKPGPDDRAIDTGKLVSHLKQARLDAGEHGLALDRDTTLSPDVLAHVIGAWGVMRERNFVRTVCTTAEGELWATAGLSNTHFCLSGDEGGHPASPVKMIDASPGGYCLEWSADVPDHAKIGDVIALRSAQDRNWSIAVIRWVSQIEQRTLRLGVELLSPRAMPCGARAQHKAGEVGDLMRALLLPEIKLAGQPDTLITPGVGFREQQKVTLVQNGEESCVQLLGKVSSTAAFSQFEFRHIPQLGEVAARDMGQVVETRFSSVWNEI